MRSRFLTLVFGPALFGLFGVSSAFAQDSNFYCDERLLGEQFYCEEEMVEEEVAPPRPVEVMEPKKQVIKDFEAFQEELDEAKSVAVFTGDPKDIEHYMRLQKKAGEMSSRFMEEYQVLGWQDPTLSYTAAVPVETFAKNAYQAERRQEIEKHIKAVNDRYGFFYFYSKDCAACVQFGPIVKSLSARHGLTVMPIAKAGKETIEWPGTKEDNGIGERVGLIGDVTPAIVLYDSAQETGIPISYGAVSLETLENRIYMLTREEKVKFLGGTTDVR